jgi:hypothetical protein
MSSRRIGPKAASRCAETIRPIVGERRRLDGTVVLGVAQELGGGIGEGRARLHEAGERFRVAPRRARRAAIVRRCACEVPGGRTAPVGPRRPGALLDLAAVGQAVPRVPARAPRAVTPEDVACGRFELGHDPKRMPWVGTFRDKLGQSSSYSELTANEKPTVRGFRPAPERIRTSDLRFRRTSPYLPGNPVPSGNACRAGISHVTRADTRRQERAAIWSHLVPTRVPTARAPAQLVGLLHGQYRPRLSRRARTFDTKAQAASHRPPDRSDGIPPAEHGSRHAPAATNAWTAFIDRAAAPPINRRVADPEPPRIVDRDKAARPRAHVTHHANAPPTQRVDTEDVPHR